MRTLGTVIDVEIDRLGDELTVDAPASSTTLTVDDAVNFVEEEGGTLVINGQVIAYTEADDDTGVITLAEPLDADAFIGDRVEVWNTAQSGVFAEWTAWVAEVGSLDNDDPIEATVEHGLIDKLPEGIRNPGEGEVVDLELRGWEWWVVAIRDRVPVVDGSYINPLTLPTPPLTDGLPPSVSPAATVTPGILSLIVTWDATVNPDAVVYEVHISTTSGFTPDSTTLLEDGYAGTLKYVTSMPDGSELDPDTVYYVRLVAKDRDPGTAPPGVEGSGSPLRLVGTTHITDESIDTPQLRANSVTAAKALVTEIVAGGLSAEIAILGALWTALTGRRTGMTAADGFLSIDQNGDPLVSLPNDGSAAIINLDVIALSLLALNGGIFRGTSRITKGGALELESATETPMVSPIVVRTWPSVALTVDDFPTAKRGLYWNAADSTWFFCVAIGEDTSVLQVDAAGAPVAGWSLTTNFAAFNGQGGITKIGSTWYILGVNTDTGNWYVSRHDASFNVLGSWQYTDESSGFRPAIGTDGVNILIARVAPNDGSVIKIRAYNPTTGALVSTVNTSLGAGNVDVTSLSVGSFDFGATRYVIGISPVASGSGLGTAVQVYNSSGVNQPNEGWLPANFQPIAGLAWNGIQWWSLSQSSSNLHRYVENIWTSESSKWWVGYSMRDGDAVGGTHETPLSPLQSFTMYKRAQLQWTAPSIPDSGGTDDPDRVRIWVGRGASEPAESAMWLNDSPAEGIVTGSVDAAVFSGTHFTGGKGTDFPDSTPAEIRTVDGRPLIRANGRVRLRLTDSTQNIIAGSDRSVFWTSALSDTDNMWDPLDSARITPPFEGQYFLAYNVLFAANATGHRKAWMEVSDDGVVWTMQPATQTFDTGVGGVEGGNSNALGMLIPVTAGQVFRLRVWQNSGGALDISAYLSLIYEGPS